MILRKTLLAVSAVVLLSTPAWALANQPTDHSGKHASSTTPGGPPATTPNNTDNPGVGNGEQGTGNSNNPAHPGHPSHPSHPEHPKHPGKPGSPKHPAHPGNPRKCMAHNVAYIVSGTLVSQTLSKNADGTYSGTVTVSVTHTNRHAAAAKGMTETYTLTDAHLTFALRDTNNDGSVGLDDLAAGDRVKAIGKITTLSKKCDQSKFTSQTTIGKVIFHAPR
jgi:hypothetical protein